MKVSDDQVRLSLMSSPISLFLIILFIWNTSQIFSLPSVVNLRSLSFSLSLSLSLSAFFSLSPCLLLPSRSMFVHAMYDTILLLTISPWLATGMKFERYSRRDSINITFSRNETERKRTKEKERKRGRKEEKEREEERKRKKERKKGRERKRGRKEEKEETKKRRDSAKSMHPLLTSSFVFIVLIPLSLLSFTVFPLLSLSLWLIN